MNLKLLSKGMVLEQSIAEQIKAMLNYCQDILKIVGKLSLSILIQLFFAFNLLFAQDSTTRVTTKIDTTTIKVGEQVNLEIKIESTDLSNIIFPEEFNFSPKSPTVLPLEIEGWSSLHTVIDDDKFWESIDSIKEAGAEDILVCPIEKMVR